MRPLAIPYTGQYWLRGGSIGKITKHFLKKRSTVFQCSVRVASYIFQLKIILSRWSNLHYILYRNGVYACKYGVSCEAIKGHHACMHAYTERECIHACSKLMHACIVLNIWHAHLLFVPLHEYQHNNLI